MSNKSGRFHYMTAADDAALRSDVLNELREENARLRTIQAELLSALEEIALWTPQGIARAAIARAKETT